MARHGLILTFAIKILLFEFGQEKVLLSNSKFGLVVCFNGKR